MSGDSLVDLSDLDDLKEVNLKICAYAYKIEHYIGGGWQLTINN